MPTRIPLLVFLLLPLLLVVLDAHAAASSFANVTLLRPSDTQLTGPTENTTAANSTIIPRKLRLRANVTLTLPAITTTTTATPILVSAAFLRVASLGFDFVAQNSSTSCLFPFELSAASACRFLHFDNITWFTPPQLSEAALLSEISSNFSIVFSAAGDDGAPAATVDAEAEALLVGSAINCTLRVATTAANVMYLPNPFKGDADEPPVYVNPADVWTVCNYYDTIYGSAFHLFVPTIYSAYEAQLVARGIGGEPDLSGRGAVVALTRTSAVSTSYCWSTMVDPSVTVPASTCLASCGDTNVTEAVAGISKLRYGSCNGSAAPAPPMAADVAALVAENFTAPESIQPGAVVYYATVRGNNATIPTSPSIVLPSTVFKFKPMCMYLSDRSTFQYSMELAPVTTTTTTSTSTSTETSTTEAAVTTSSVAGLTTTTTSSSAASTSATSTATSASTSTSAATTTTAAAASTTTTSSGASTSSSPSSLTSATAAENTTSTSTATGTVDSTTTMASSPSPSNESSTTTTASSTTSTTTTSASPISTSQTTTTAPTTTTSITTTSSASATATYLPLPSLATVWKGAQDSVASLAAGARLFTVSPATSSSSVPASAKSTVFVSASRTQSCEITATVAANNTRKISAATAADHSELSTWLSGWSVRSPTSDQVAAAQSGVIVAAAQLVGEMPQFSRSVIEALFGADSFDPLPPSTSISAWKRPELWIRVALSGACWNPLVFGDQEKQNQQQFIFLRILAPLRRESLTSAAAATSSNIAATATVFTSFVSLNSMSAFMASRSQFVGAVVGCRALAEENSGGDKALSVVEHPTRVSIGDGVAAEFAGAAVLNLVLLLSLLIVGRIVVLLVTKRDDRHHYNELMMMSQNSDGDAQQQQSSSSSSPVTPGTIAAAALRYPGLLFVLAALYTEFFAKQCFVAIAHGTALQLALAAIVAVAVVLFVVVVAVKFRAASTARMPAQLVTRSSLLDQERHWMLSLLHLPSATASANTTGGGGFSTIRDEQQRQEARRILLLIWKKEELEDWIVKHIVAATPSLASDHFATKDEEDELESLLQRNQEESVAMEDRASTTGTMSSVHQSSSKNKNNGGDAKSQSFQQRLLWLTGLERKWVDVDDEKQLGGGGGAAPKRLAASTFQQDDKNVPLLGSPAAAASSTPPISFSNGQSRQLFTRRFGCFFSEFTDRAPFWAALELLFSIVCGVLEGMHSGGDRSQCDTAAIVYLSLHGIYLLVVLALRPFLAGTTLIFVVLVTLFQICSIVALLAGSSEAALSLSTVSNIVLIVKAAVDLLVLASMLLRFTSRRAVKRLKELHVRRSARALHEQQSRRERDELELEMDVVDATELLRGPNPQQQHQQQPIVMSPVAESSPAPAAAAVVSVPPSAVEQKQQHAEEDEELLLDINLDEELENLVLAEDNAAPVVPQKEEEQQQPPQQQEEDEGLLKLPDASPAVSPARSTTPSLTPVQQQQRAMAAERRAELNKKFKKL